MKEEAIERKERHDRLLQAIREKHQVVLDSRNDEITELKMRLADSQDSQDKLKIECDSL